MAYSMAEVVLGSLLHDVGKFLQRSFNRVEEVAGRGYDLESTLCPSDKGNYTHKHVLFTNAFFDLMRRENLFFPEGVNAKTVEDIASYHHKPDACGTPAASWLCTLGDRFSAGMERREDEETSHRSPSRTAFRTTPQQCIFDEVILDIKALGKPQRHAYTLGVLNPEDPEGLIPQEWPQNGSNIELPQLYRQLWSEFWDELKVLGQHAPELSVRLFEEALLGLLERYTWAIPSSTVDSPDISLYDHARTTAAIAACLYRYHEARGQLDDVKAIKDEQQPKFRFVAGDLSGIQSTLFSLQTQGVKGVNKILRARSFMIGAMSEAAGLLVLEALDLPLCTVLQQAGGRFLVLTPALDGIEELVDSLRERFDNWLLKKYTGTLALNLALSSPFPSASFRPHPLREVMAQLGQAIEEGKQRPLSKCSQGVLQREFPVEAVCSSCGLRPAEPPVEDGYRCPTCSNELLLGRRLIHSDMAVWGRQLPRRWHPVDVLGLEVALLDHQPEEPLAQSLSVRKTHDVPMSIPWAIMNLANHIPLFKDHYEGQNPRYQWLRDEDIDTGAGDPKSFSHIAAEALELEENGTFRGKRFLALLKADVDYLGFIFSFGLKRPHADEDRFTLSRLAQLSRMLDLYFTGYLKGLLQREFPDTYTVYAGGDDLLLIGPWWQTLALTSRINETFRAYTGHNPNITLSAGVTLLKPNYPVNRAVREVEDYLEASKDQGRNLVCALMKKPVSWDRYGERLRDAEWIHQRMHADFPVSTGFVYHILDLAKDAEAVAVHGDVRRAGWRARLAYHLARNIKARNAPEKQQQIVQWLEHLGLDDQFKLTSGHPNIVDWRLPLAIALYRNRT
jgi:CRISPR-associated protein Csm1